MAIINEIPMGANAKYNGMLMFRKADYTKEIFQPHYFFNNDNELSLASNIVVNYIEYFKNSNGDIVEELTKHKYYVVGNRAAEYRIERTLITPEVLYAIGEVISPAIYYAVGEIITPEIVIPPLLNLDGTVHTEVSTTPAVLGTGVELKTEQVIATGTEIKTEAVYQETQVLVKAEWLGANRWFLSVARTPMTAPYGIMDGIELTLAGLPMDIPNGYVLQQPL